MKMTLLVCVVALVLGGCADVTPQEKYRNGWISVSLGEEGQVLEKDGIPACPTTADYDAYLVAGRAKDEKALDELTSTARLQWLTPGTRVIPADQQDSYYKVRVLTGDHKDQYLWVASVWVGPLAKPNN